MFRFLIIVYHFVLQKWELSSNTHSKSKSSLAKKSKVNAVYNTKLPKIKRFINIYQANGGKTSKKNLHIKSKVVKDDKLNPIKVQDSSPIDEDKLDNRSLESSLDVLAVSSEVVNHSQNQPTSTDTSMVKHRLQSDSQFKVRKGQDRNTTITPDVNTSLPSIGAANTTRNARKALVSNKRAQRRFKAGGKPPLWIDTNKKLYPDASNYKHGTANNKILQLREHLTRSNTVSNPDLLKEEQAIIDTMFGSKERQASRGRKPFSSALHSGIRRQRSKKKHVSSKAANSTNTRSVYSAAGDKKQTRNQVISQGMTRKGSKKALHPNSNFNSLTFRPTAIPARIWYFPRPST